MSRSEIDDIFATRPKKKIKTTPSQQQRVPTSSHHSETEKRGRGKKHAKVDNDRFKDSRGSIPRRKTVDGYNIYKEDELGISTTGGDTPLCPFDCQCCF